MNDFGLAFPSRPLIVISVVILTRNEAENLPTCLTALDWCDDIHLVDSGSSDGTVPLAREHSVKIHQHPFESFGQQRNWALDHCPFAHSWILFLDADEVATPDFRNCLETTLGSADEKMGGYYCCWKLMYGDRWLKRCDSFPRWQFRLLRKGRARFCDFGHGQREAEVQGELGYIREPYLHFPWRKGIRHWMDRHNVYSDQEARTRLGESTRFVELLSKHPAVRAKALKLLVSHIPGWPLLRFAWQYFVRLGFFEGRPGLIYCVSLAYYEFLIKVKMEELRRKGFPRAQHDDR